MQYRYLYLLLLLFFFNCNNKSTNIITEEKTTEIISEPKGYLVSDSLNFSLGDIQFGNRIEKEFNLVNQGTEEVKIIGYEKSCSCTDLKVNKEVVKPNDTLKILMIVETKDKIIGTHKINATLKTNGQRTFYLLTADFNLIK